MGVIDSCGMGVVAVMGAIRGCGVGVVGGAEGRLLSSLYAGNFMSSLTWLQRVFQCLPLLHISAIHLLLTSLCL